jgi:hypothetical protein
LLELIKGSLSHYFYGRGFYVFLFENKEHMDLIFRNRPYFYRTKSIYLNRWTPNFNPKNDLPYAIPIWVRLSHIPVHCWNGDAFRSIRIYMGNYIDKVEPRDEMFSCA